MATFSGRAAHSVNGILFAVFLFVILFSFHLGLVDRTLVLNVSLTFNFLTKQTRVVSSENVPFNHQCQYVALDATLKLDLRCD